MHNKYTFYIFLFIAALSSCKVYDAEVKPTDTIKTGGVVATNDASITSAKLEAKNNAGIIDADVVCTINNKNEIIGILPNIDAKKKLTLTFTTKATGTTVKVSDTVQVSGVTRTDFSKPVTFNTAATNGDTKAYKVMIKVFTGLPIFNLTTDGPITSKETYVKGTLNVNPNVEFEQAVTKIPLQIRGRGNSTWTEFPKKPYRMKFDTKTALLGMPAAKNWVLLANYADKTLMRNRIALMLGKRLGADFTADSRYVEVFLNGDFVGNYLLTSQVEVNENRVNIKEQKPTDTDITGGYLLELDTKAEEVVNFKTTKGIPLSLKSPEDATPAQVNYIKTYIQATEDAMFASNWNDPTNGYAKYINPESFINWYLTQEVMLNNDARDFSSVFYYKDRGGKLGMGPVWDFDTSSGNIDYTNAKNPTGTWFIRDATWMFRLVQDVNFNIKVRNRWAAVKDNEVKQLFTDIDETAEYLKLSQKKNFERWPIIGKYVWPNAIVFPTYADEVWYLKDFLTKRYNWIGSNINNF